MFPYPISRDYDELIHLMQSGHELVCLCDYQGCRDIARTRYEPPTTESDKKAYFAVQARGICYAGGLHLYIDEFKKDCHAVNLEFIPPLREALEAARKSLWDVVKDGRSSSAVVLSVNNSLQMVIHASVIGYQSPAVPKASIADQYLLIELPRSYGEVWFWAPDQRGYTRDVTLAGRYTQETAHQIIQDSTGEVIAMRESDLSKLVINHVIDLGWGDNGRLIKTLYTLALPDSALA